MRCLTCMKIKKTQAIQNDARHPVYGWFKQFESLSPLAGVLKCLQPKALQEIILRRRRKQSDDCLVCFI